MIRVGRAAHLGAAFLCASFAGALAVTAAIAWLNPFVSARDCAWFVVDLWIAWTLFLMPPTTALLIAARALGRSSTAGDAPRFAMVAGFVFLWFARLEPAHQPTSVRPHVSGWGLVELTIIAVGAAVAAFAPARRMRLGRRWLVTGAAVAGSSVILWVTALAIEPSTRRDVEIAPIAARFAASRGPGASARRVLVVGVDGLEWRTLAWMIGHGRMPAVRRLLESGRFFQHDNRRMGYSPAIWTAVYTGQPETANRIGDFVTWQFAGARHEVPFLPRFGMHAVCFLDEFLARTAGFGLWDDIAVESKDSPTLPIWSIASSAGRRVGLFEPLPYQSTAERIEGFQAFGADDGQLSVVWSGRESGTTREALAGPDASADAVAQARQSAQQAASLFRRSRPDLGVFYTHFVDTTQHLGWDYALGTRYFGGDPAAGLDERFDRTRIRAAYDAVDDVVATLVDAFGSDATVVLVSDHGWRYDDYEHFRSPNGVLILSPFEERGYGGVADVLSTAPTILALLGVPVDGSMQAALAPLQTTKTDRAYASVIEREFLAPSRPDRERQRRLRALGYFDGRTTRPSP